jgi:putative iron-only hydrogenase system regulator
MSDSVLNYQITEIPRRKIFMPDKRLGVIGIVIENRTSAAKVNQVLSEHSDMIIGRMGLPYREKNVSVISLIVDGDTDQLGSLTGKLGAIPDVVVKSALTKIK